MYYHWIVQPLIYTHRIRLSMQIIEVKNKADWKLFHALPHRIYKGDPNWICPIEGDIETVFSPDKNKAFEDGEAVVYVAVDSGKPIGRIAAFIDHARNKKKKQLVGGIGFFECINDKSVAFALFQQAEDYLQGKGITTIDGPVNFGERQKFWGLLVDGFDPPIFRENYNPNYYRAFFEEWGFVAFDQILTLKGAIENVPSALFSKIAARLKESTNFRTEMIDFRKADKYVKDFCSIYNASFAKFEHFKPLEEKKIMSLFDTLKPVADPRLICFAYDGDLPIGLCVLIPEINPFMKHAKGKLNLWNKIRFAIRKKMAHKPDIKGVAMGIHPDYQSKGVFMLIADALYDYAVKNYSHVLLATIRGHNSVMIKTTKKLNVDVDRVHIAFRKSLNGEVVEPLEFYDYN